MTCRDPPLYTLLSALSQAQNSPAKLRAKHQHLQPASQLALRSLIRCQGWDRLYCSSGCPGAIPFLHQHLWSHCSPLPCNKPRQSQEQRWVQGLQTEPQLLWIFFFTGTGTPYSHLCPTWDLSSSPPSHTPHGCTFPASANPSTEQSTHPNQPGDAEVCTHTSQLRPSWAQNTLEFSLSLFFPPFSERFLQRRTRRMHFCLQERMKITTLST